MQTIDVDYRDLNTLAARVHKSNEKWWIHPVEKTPITRNTGELLMLAITELAEAVEGERKNMMDDKLPHRKMAEVEMADCYIRLLDLSAGFHVDLRYVGFEGLSDNKGEAILQITRQIVLACEHFTFINNALAAIRAYCKMHNYDLYGAFEEKMDYNSVRADHKHEARVLAGGKQW